MDKKQLAQHLYMTQGKTQKEIALEVGVSERTIYTWIHQYAWDKLRLAAYQAPATISENLCCQLTEMQNAIARREPGCRYPDQKEAEVIRKLVLSIETMKKYPSLSQNMQMMESFRNYVRPLNPQFTQQLAHYSERFLSEKSIGGFAPYQMEYGIEQITPVAPFYDELEGDEPCDSANPPKYCVPCTHIDDCLHPGSCAYPKCKYEIRFEDDPKTDTMVISPVAVGANERSEADLANDYHNFMKANGYDIKEPSAPDAVSPLLIPLPKPEATGSKPAIPPIETTGNSSISGLQIIPISPGSLPPFGCSQGAAIP